MAYVRFNVLEELRKVSREKKTKADPYVLLCLIADDYLEGKRAGRRDDSVDFLERIYKLDDPRESV